LPRLGLFMWFICSLLNPWLWLLEMLQKIFRTLVYLLFLSFLVCFPWPFKSFLSFLPKQERLLHDLGESPGEFATPESPDCSMEGSPRSVNPQGKILDFVKKEGLLRMLRICFIWFWLKEISGTLKKWTHISTVHIQSTYSKYFIPIFVAAIHFPMVHLIFETIIFVGDFPMLSWRYWSLESLLGSHPIHNVAPLLTGEEVGNPWISKSDGMG